MLVKLGCSSDDEHAIVTKLILVCEMFILETLNYNVYAPTAIDFLVIFAGELYQFHDSSIME
jgi:hypothetical protein